MKKHLIIALCLLVLLISGCIQKTSEPEEEKDKSLSDVEEKGKIVVGMDIPYGVMEFLDENEKIVGLEPDIAKEIALQLGVELVLLDYDWDDIFTDIKSGELDIAITSMTITEERSKEMLFSQPYFNAGQTIVVNEDNVDIKEPQDLSGKKVGAQKDTTSIEEAFKYTDSSLVFGYKEGDDEAGVWNDLKTGEIDAVVIDYVAAISRVRKDSSFKIAGEPFTDEFYGVPTKLGNIALMDRINEILRDMRISGKLKEIKDKWLGE